VESSGRFASSTIFRATIFGLALQAPGEAFFGDENSRKMADDAI
jgi:hypothetical protein